jgi:hypothetical protein
LLSGLASKQVFNAYFYSFVPALNLLLFYYDLGCRSTYLHIYLFKMGPIMKGLVSKNSHIMIVFELLAIFKAVLVPYQKSIFLSLLALCIGYCFKSLILILIQMIPNNLSKIEAEVN